MREASEISSLNNGRRDAGHLPTEPLAPQCGLPLLVSEALPCLHPLLQWNDGSAPVQVVPASLHGAAQLAIEGGIGRLLHM